MLYEYCDEHEVAYNRCGKLIVATEEDQLPRLGERVCVCACGGGVTGADEFLERSMVNGMVRPRERVERVSGEEAMAMEPELRCVGALLSPDTGA